MNIQRSKHGLREMLEFPKIVNIEVYRGGCPASCIHCPLGVIKPSKRKDKFGEKGMELSLFTKIIQEISNHENAAVRIHSVGEPLLWNYLSEALKIASRKKVNSWVFTSAISSNTHLLEDICEHASIVEVSVNSINTKEYIDTKGIDAFAQVKANIEHMSNFISRKKINTRLLVSRVQSANKDIDEEFVKYWDSSGLVANSFVRGYHSYNDLLKRKPFDKPEQKKEPCLVHWSRFNISIEGDAVICFNELFKKEILPDLILGNIKKESIREIWHGSKLLALRQAEIQSDYTNIDYADILPCKTCSFCQPLSTKQQTSEYQLKELNRHV